MPQYVYSPYPPASYKLEGIARDEVSVILDLEEHHQAVWNLFWLSTPTLDNLVKVRPPDWRQVYRPIVGALASIIRDVVEDEVLFRKLQMHPTAFLDWFEREDYSIYDSYNALGGDFWADTVMGRAELANERITLESPTVSFRNNVVKVDFGRLIA